MIPKIEDIKIGEDIEIIKEPSKTYKMDFKIGRITEYIDELESIEQAIYKILSTERYEYEIYDWDYGIETSDLFGKPTPFVYSELKRRIKEALMQDDRIIDVDNFMFESPKYRDVVSVQFTVHTIFGEIYTSREVIISD